MSKHQIKTNNDPSRTCAKVNLRMMSIKNIDKPVVLECFAGQGILWDSVRKETGKEITVHGIDEKKYVGKINLVGKSERFLEDIDLSAYDVIDLDAYGFPDRHLDILSKKNYTGIIHVTFIQSGMGAIPHSVLLANGITKKMIKKVKTIFYTQGLSKVLIYMQDKFTFDNVFIHRHGRKNYFYIVPRDRQ